VSRSKFLSLLSQGVSVASGAVASIISELCIESLHRNPDFSSSFHVQDEFLGADEA
jgi:hypothetical protein